MTLSSQTMSKSGAMRTSNGKMLVEVRGLKKYFPITQGIILQRKVADVQAAS